MIFTIHSHQLLLIMSVKTHYFKEAVKLAITPMISTLSLMENAESESEVLGLGLSVIVLNLECI